MKNIFKNSFVLPILLLITSMAQARADFSGHWVADSGKVSSNIGLSANCTRVEITIEQTANALLTKKYESSCGLYGSNWGPVQEDLQGNQVLEQGEVVGSISDDTLLTTVADGGANYAYNLRLVKGPNGETILKSYYGAQNSAGAIVIEADLHKAQ